jgi:TonB family protein
MSVSAAVPRLAAAGAIIAICLANPARGYSAAQQESVREGPAAHLDRATSSYDARRYSEARSELLAARTAIDGMRDGANPTPHPKRISAGAPAYPAAAIKAGRSGLVGLKLIIDGNGKVRDIQVLQSVPGLDDAAKAAARSWRYEPTAVGGRTVDVPLVTGVSFVYRDDRPFDEAISWARFYQGQSEFNLATGQIDRAMSIAADEEHWFALSNSPVNMSTPGFVPPRRTQYVGPVVPEPAVQEHAEGTVMIEFILDSTGIVRAARILRSVPLLDQAALDSVRKTRYSPATLNGVPIVFKMIVTVNFPRQ